MEISVTFQPEIPACLIRGKGAITDYRDMIQVVDQALSVANEQDCPRFLFDLRRTDITAGTMDTFRGGSDIEALGFDRHSKIAIVYSHDESEHKFLETVAVNRGFMIRVFVDIAAAAKWLKTTSVAYAPDAGDKKQPELK